MKKLASFWHRLLQPTVFIPCSIIFSVIVTYMVEFVIFGSTRFVSEPYFSLQRFLIITIMIASIINLLRFARFFCSHLDWAFLYIMLGFGSLFIFAFPKIVHVSPDDHVHFRRAYVMTQDSAYWSDGFKILDSAIDSQTEGMSQKELEQFHASLNQAHDASKDELIAFPEDKNLYERLVYLPYYIGFKLSAFLNLSFTATITIAKLFNFIFYTLIMFFAIRISYRARKIFFIVGLMTTSVYYATQFSYDPTVISCISLTTAIFLHIIETGKATPKLLFAFATVGFWGCLPKAVYCPILLLGLLIPNRFFDTQRRAKLYKAILAVLVVLLASTFVLPVILGSMTSDIRGGNTSVSGQISYILHNPLEFLFMFIRYCCGKLPNLMFGQAAFISFPISYNILPAKARFAESLIYYSEFILLLWAIFTTTWPKRLRTIKMRFAFLLNYICCVLAIIMALYLCFTTVGSDDILGVQHRYFIPLIPLLSLILSPKSSQLPASKDKALPQPAQGNLPLLLIPSGAISLCLSMFFICTAIA